MTDVERYRQEKDDFFASDSHSPIEDADFKGLSYFAENELYIFELAIKKSSSREIVMLQTSQGDSEAYIRYGTVSFELEGQDCRLSLFAQAYELSPRNMFIPFKDLTSTKESYGAGRYLESRLVKGTDDMIVLDFNYAYNPYCAYSSRWRCPLAPAENHLSVAIKAGEKTYV